MIINYFILVLTFSLVYLFGLFFTRINIRLNIINIPKFYFFQKIILGLFFLSFFNLFINYFFKLHSLVVYFILIMIIFFEFIFSYKNLLKNLKKIIIYSLIFFPFMYILKHGYDGSLYHIPHQAILQNEKIIFGLANIHNRYSLTGIYSYLVSPFWNSSFLNIYIAFGTIFFSLIFIFLFEVNKNKKIHIFLLTIGTLFFSYISTRYAGLSYSQLDYKFGVFFFITIFYGFLIIKKENLDKSNLFFFIIVTFFSASLKPSGVILFLYLFFVLIFLIKNNYLKFKSAIYYLLIPSFFFLTWIIKSFINSGCFLFPIKLSCFKYAWTINYTELDNLNISVIKWNNFLEVFIKNFSINIFDIYIVLILIFIIIFFCFFYAKNLKKIIEKNSIFNILVYINLFIIFISVLFLPDSKNFLTFLHSNKLSLATNIIKNELYFLTLITLLFFHLFFIIFCKFRNKELLKLNFKMIINVAPFIIIFLFILTIIFKAQNPRFAIGIFLSFYSAVIFLFLNFIKNIKLEQSYNIIVFGFIFLISKLFFFDNNFSIKNKNIFFEKISLPYIKAVPRKNFGYSANDNLCFAILYCYPYEDVRPNYLKYGYKMFLKE